MRLLSNINSWIAKAETALIVLVLLFMVLFAFLQVVMRNILDLGILWGDILLRHLVLWVGFIGASLATREKKHINIDILTRFLPEKIKPVSGIITGLFAVFICWFLTDAAWTFIMDEKSFDTKIFGDIPVWYFQIIIPVGFCLMAFRFFILVLQNVQKLISDEADK